MQGLGKTLQTISFLAYLKHHRGLPGPHLIVVPKSTLQNWAREFGRWAPEFNVVTLTGSKDERNEIINTRLITQEFEVLITSYEICLIEKSALKKFSFAYIVIDEAHRIKNVDSILSQIVRSFKSRGRMLITGTPLQNNLKELFALLNFICPEIFSDFADLEAFLHKDDNKIAELSSGSGTTSGITSGVVSGAASVAGDDAEESKGGKPGETEEERKKREEEDTSKRVVEALHKILRPFLLRRVKSDVEKNLLPSMKA